MACTKCKTSACTCEEKYFKVVGCLVKCNLLTLAIHTAAENAGGVDVPQDPVSLTLFLERPDGTTTRLFWNASESSGIDRLDKGTFSIDYFADLPGRYDVLIQADKKSISDHFFIEDTGVDCALDTKFTLAEAADAFSASATTP